MKIKARGSGGETLRQEHKRVNWLRWSSTVLAILEDQEEQAAEIEGEEDREGMKEK